MSQQAVQSIIGKAVLDAGFRSTLFADPDSALAGYELSDAEMAALRTVDAESLELAAGSLDERVSKSLAIGFTREDVAMGRTSKGGIPQHLPEGF
jgi:hypothetical protein